MVLEGEECEAAGRVEAGLVREARSVVSLVVLIKRLSIKSVF